MTNYLHIDRYKFKYENKNQNFATSKYRKLADWQTLPLDEDRGVVALILYS
jgi:hypothetical protein